MLEGWMHKRTGRNISGCRNGYKMNTAASKGSILLVTRRVMTLHTGSIKAAVGRFRCMTEV